MKLNLKQAYFEFDNDADDGWMESVMDGIFGGDDEFPVMVTLTPLNFPTTDLVPNADEWSKTVRRSVADVEAQKRSKDDKAGDAGWLDCCAPPGPKADPYDDDDREADIVWVYNTAVEDDADMKERLKDEAAQKPKSAQEIEAEAVTTPHRSKFTRLNPPPSESPLWPQL